MIIFQLLVLFVFGCIFGWLYEFIFWSVVKKKMYNPGFLSGPYLPVYGFGVIILFFVGLLDFSFITKVILFMVLATLLELVTGLWSIYYNKVRLWDYSKNLFNFKGVISLKFSLGWAFFGALFLYFVYPRLDYLNNYYFILILVLFYVIFIIDLIITLRLFRKIRKNIILINKKNHTKKVLNYLFYKGALMRKRKVSIRNFLMPLHKMDDMALYKDLENYMKHKD